MIKIVNLNSVNNFFNAQLKKNEQKLDKAFKKGWTEADKRWRMSYRKSETNPEGVPFKTGNLSGNTRAQYFKSQFKLIFRSFAVSDRGEGYHRIVEKRKPFFNPMVKYITNLINAELKA